MSYDGICPCEGLTGDLSAYLWSRLKHYTSRFASAEKCRVNLSSQDRGPAGREALGMVEKEKDVYGAAETLSSLEGNVAIPRRNRSKVAYADRHIGI